MECISKHLKKHRFTFFILIIIFCFCFTGCSESGETGETQETGQALSASQSAVSEEPTEEASPASQSEQETVAQEATGVQSSDTADASSSQLDLGVIPAYTGAPYIEINGNQPVFTAQELASETFESYSPLDSLGRVGTAYAMLGQELMPTEERGDISGVKPTGWVQNDYDFVDGGKLYNRAHLIAFQLAGENANERNLITGTRYLNTEGMLEFEEQVGDYIRETGNHVLYRVTPIYAGDNLVASGVHMEAQSVEDNGAGVSFNVYCYNVQPGVVIDYATGENHLDDSGLASDGDTSEGSGSDGTAQVRYILNTRSMKFHYPDCESVAKMSEKNKQEFTGSRDEVIALGYSSCGNCQP